MPNVLPLDLIGICWDEAVVKVNQHVLPRQARLKSGDIDGGKRTAGINRLAAGSAGSLAGQDRRGDDPQHIPGIPLTSGGTPAVMVLSYPSRTRVP